ncbi:MAG: Rrf2 family transcriptional regulator [Clostridiales Family XIII bacterium]|jgi:Rrf2 family protein|nr:Rrf2 family transcriptional regulator [Clostridiales Family XIII bacterium]
MRISVKGRYALAAAINIADRAERGGNISASSIADELKISKIYLEQVFAQLKKANVLSSVKGPKGGYRLAKSASETTAWDVLTAIELSITEVPEETVRASAPEIEMSISENVFKPLDDAIKSSLQSVTVRDMLEYARRQDESLAYAQGI